MTEEPTRATPRVDRPRYGRVGPDDPRADPATRPAMLPADLPPGDGSTRPVPLDVPPGAEDPTRRTPLPGAPSSEPGTVPPGEIDLRPAEPVPGTAGTRLSGLWTGLVLSAVVLILLLVFILQNNVPVVITFLWLSGSLPVGVAMLFAAVAGLLLVAIPGGLRILQLRRAARRSARR